MKLSNCSEDKDDSGNCSEEFDRRQGTENEESDVNKYKIQIKEKINTPKIDFTKTDFTPKEKELIRKEVELIKEKYPKYIPVIVRPKDKSIQLLSQYVTTLPKATPIDLNTASIEVLMAISPSISRDDAEKITLARVIQPFKSTGDFLKLLQSAVSSGSQMVLDNSQIDVKSQFWLAQSDIELGRSHFLNVTLIQRTDNLPEKGNSTQVIWTQLSNSIRP